MGQVGAAIILCFLFGPLLLCILGFMTHPVAGIVAVAYVLTMIVLLIRKKSGAVVWLWAISGLLSLVWGALTASGLIG